MALVFGMYVGFATYDSATGKQVVKYYFPMTGSVLGSGTEPMLIPTIDITNPLIAISTIVTIVSVVLGLLWRLEWKLKYRKSRTPIVMPVKSKN